MNIFRVPLNAIMVVLLSLIEVQQVSIQTTLVRPTHRVPQNLSCQCIW
jgi:hypothetical protein